MNGTFLLSDFGSRASMNKKLVETEVNLPKRNNFPSLLPFFQTVIEKIQYDHLSSKV